MSKAEIVAPFLYNTCEKPNNPNNYSVWIPRNDDNKCQIYIDRKWFTFVAVQIETNQDELEENKIVTDKEYNLIKAIREYIKED